MTGQRPRRAKVRRGYLPAESEAAFLQKVEQEARHNGWLVYHTHRSDRSAAGFPDLVMVRPPRLIFAELKAQDAPPRVLVRERPAVAQRPAWLRDLAVTHDQASWLEALDAVMPVTRALDHYDRVGGEQAPSVEVYLWRPSDGPAISVVLARGRGPAPWEGGEDGSMP